MGAGQRPLDREQLGGGVVVLLGGRLVRDDGDALTQLFESRGERRQFGQGGGHALMMTYPRR